MTVTPLGNALVVLLMELDWSAISFFTYFAMLQKYSNELGTHNNVKRLVWLNG